LFRIPLSFTSLATGRYSWSFNATWSGPGGSLAENFPSSHLSYVNRADSEFGKGWYHEDLAKLKIESNGLLLIAR
jgi:hypothetical protein